MVAGQRAFGAYVGVAGMRRQWGPSLVASSLVFLALGILVATLGARQAVQLVEKVVDVKFVEKIVNAPPPPPPQPEVVAKPEPLPPPAAAAPVVRPDQKIRKLDKPPPPKRLVAPKEMPQAAPKEADPSQDKGVAVYGEPGQGDPAGLEGGQAGGVAGGVIGGAIALPEDAEAPIPAESNAKPDYPQEARDTGKTGTVVLKVYILASGAVAEVEVMRGQEPFVSAAVKAVRKWKYTPAMYKGQPITVYRIIQIPFKLTA